MPPSSPLLLVLGGPDFPSARQLRISIFSCKLHKVFKKRLAYMFVDKIRLHLERRRKLKPIFNICMLELVHKPNLGIEYYKIKTNFDALAGIHNVSSCM